jgi:hypothetical protein
MQGQWSFKKSFMLLKFWSDLVIKIPVNLHEVLGANLDGCVHVQCMWYTNMYIWRWWMTQRILLTKCKKEAVFFKTCILSWHACFEKIQFMIPWFKKKKVVSWHDILIDVILTWDLIISMSNKINPKSFNDATCNYLKWLKIISLKFF